MNSKIDIKIIESIANEVDDKYRDKFINFLSMYRHKDWVYFDVIKRNLNANNADTQNIINLLIKHKVAILGYRHFCPNCTKEFGLFIDADSQQSEDEIYCDTCDEVIPKDSKHYILKIV